jgi:hypothetical protein
VKVLPSAIGVGIPLHQESSAIAHLRHGSEFPEIPNDGCQNILSWFKQRSEIYGLKAPVEEISTRRAFGCVLAVDVQEKSIVCAHMHPEVRRNGGKRDLLPEVENSRFSS